MDKLEYLSELQTRRHAMISAYLTRDTPEDPPSYTGTLWRTLKGVLGDGTRDDWEQLRRCLYHKSYKASLYAYIVLAKVGEFPAVRYRTPIGKLTLVDSGLTLKSGLNMSTWTTVAEVLSTHLDRTGMQVDRSRAATPGASAVPPPDEMEDSTSMQWIQQTSVANVITTPGYDSESATVDDITNVFLSFADALDASSSKEDSHSIRSHLYEIIRQSNIIASNRRARIADIVWMMDECAGVASTM